VDDFAQRASKAFAAVGIDIKSIQWTNLFQNRLAENDGVIVDHEAGFIRQSVNGGGAAAAPAIEFVDASETDWTIIANLGDDKWLLDSGRHFQ